MGESTFQNPHDKDIRQVEEGLGKRAVYDSTNQAWKLPTGKNAAIGEWIWVNGQIGQATAAIVGGTDAIVEGTNWTEDTDGALNALNSNITGRKILNIVSSAKTTHVFNISNSATHALFFASSTSSIYGLIIITSTSTGDVAVRSISSAGATITSSTNSITFDLGSSRVLYITDIDITGEGFINPQ